MHGNCRNREQYNKQPSQRTPYSNFREARSDNEGNGYISLPLTRKKRLGC